MRRANPHLRLQIREGFWQLSCDMPYDPHGLNQYTRQIILAGEFAAPLHPNIQTV